MRTAQKSVSIPKSAYDQCLKLWEDCFIVQFCCPIPKFPCIRAANQLWGHKGKVETISLDNEGFLFKFENIQQTLIWVLEKGPLFIDQTPLTT